MTDPNHLFRRKGGGGKGGGSKGGKSGSKGGSSAAKKYGASDSFVKSQGSKSFTLSGSGGTSSYAYAEGGGKRITLGKDSPFNGRQAGGGDRSTVYGTSHFGSGYPYGGYGAFVSSRPLPYYYYPVPCYHNYYGGDEYLDVNDSQRPGGNLVTALVQPSYNASNVIYRIVGDNSSVTSVFYALVSNCSVANTSTITRFEPPNTWPLPEQVIQYYRASSFALSLDGYNNTAALPANAPSSNQSTIFQIPDTPLPSNLNSTFLECVNGTIGASVPLADPGKKGLSNSAIAGIVIGSVVGAVIFCALATHFCARRGPKDKRKKKGKSVKTMDDVPNIHVDSRDAGSPPPYPTAYTKGPFEKDIDTKSFDERTLVADSFGHKERWSSASSSASSRSSVSDIVDQRGSVRLHDLPRHMPDSDSGNVPWSPGILTGRTDYQSLKHESTPSADSLLRYPLHSREFEADGGRRESRSLSPSRSPLASRSPSPSPVSSKFPLMHSEEKRTFD